MDDVLSDRLMNIPLCVRSGEETKGKEVACSPGLSVSFAPALLLVEGR